MIGGYLTVYGILMYSVSGHSTGYRCVAVSTRVRGVRGWLMVSQSRLVVGACVHCVVDGAVLMINAGTCWCLWQRLPIPTEHIYIAQLPRARTQHLMTLYGT